MSRQQYALRARTLIELVAVGLVVAATAGTISSAVDWGAYVVRAVPVLAAVILSRRFGVALPGKGYASFVLGVMLAAQMLDGWRLAVLTGAVGLVIGDALLRQVVVRSALSTAAHLVFGTALAGLFYDTLGGRVGEAALATANLLPLIGYAVVLPLIVNGTFYLELALREFFAWNDARLTLRWETAVYATSVGLALGWTAIALFSQTFTASIAFVALLVGGTLGMHWLISMGVRADELRMVQGIAGAVATEVSIDRSFARIQEFTHRLVPWTAMGFARYVPESHEMELVADTEMPSGTRFGAGEGLTGDAVRTQRPVVATRGEGHDELMERAYTRRSEVLLPLFQGDHLVGLWSVRHREHALYRAEDGALLNLLAPQLALSLSLTAMVSPVVQSSDRATAYARDVAAAVSGILGRAETVAGTASRAQSEAELAAGRVGQAVTRLDELVAGVRDTLITAERTQEATRAMADRAVSVRTANAATAETLEELGATVGEGASEVAHLRDAAQEVETFAETIATIASQTNLLALNATIEASRAGVHGRGFGVVADEVRKLAAESAEAARRMGRSSEATRRVLDRAARLLEEIAERLGEAASRSTHWRSDLDAIVETAEQTRAAGERMASVPRANLDLAEQTNVSLGEAQQAAAASAQEAAAVARLASDQRVAVETLVEGARELRAAAERLAAGVRFIDGGDASGNTS